MISNKHKAEYEGSICRHLGLFRIDCLANIPEPYKSDILKLVDELEKDAYDILAGKSNEEEVVEPETVVKKVIKKVTKKKVTKKKASK